MEEEENGTNTHLPESIHDKMSKFDQNYDAVSSFKRESDFN